MKFFVLIYEPCQEIFFITFFVTFFVTFRNIAFQKIGIYKSFLRIITLFWSQNLRKQIPA